MTKQEKTLASAGHVPILHPKILGVINYRGLHICPDLTKRGLRNPGLKVDDSGVEKN